MIIFAMTSSRPHCSRIHRASRQSPDSDAVARADARLRKAADAVAAALEAHDYLEDEFSIADVVMGGVLESARELDLMPDSRAPRLPGAPRRA